MVHNWHNYNLYSWKIPCLFIYLHCTIPIFISTITLVSLIHLFPCQLHQKISRFVCASICAICSISSVASALHIFTTTTYHPNCYQFHGEASRCLNPEGNGVSPSGGMGEGLALWTGSKISSWTAAEEGATLSWSKQDDWKKSPAWQRWPIVHRVRNHCVQWCPDKTSGDKTSVGTKRPETKCPETKHPETQHPWDKTSVGKKRPKRQNVRRDKMFGRPNVHGDKTSVETNVRRDKTSFLAYYQ